VDQPSEREVAMEMTLGEAFARSARKHPDKWAVMDDHGRITYACLNERVNRLVHGLGALGLGRGGHAATLSNNASGLMETYLALLKMGVVTVPMDGRATMEEMDRQLALTQATALFFHSSFSETAEEILQNHPGIEVAIGFGDNVPGFARNAEAIMGEGSPDEPRCGVGESDDAFIMFTGGTTGTPKGAVLTHRSLLWNIICVTTENHCPAPEDVTFYPMQMYHTAALSRFLAFMYAGGTFIGSAAFDAERYLAMAERERTTFIVGNSTIWRMLLHVQRTRRYNTASIRRWLHTHDPLEPDLRVEIEEVLFPQGQMYASYALTEASPAVTVLRPWDTPCHWSSVGRPYMCTEVRIADPSTDDPLPTGEIGEIQVRGPTVMRGYYRNPQETEAALRGGWLHTGDLGRYDERGYLYVVDRLKDMIKSGGLNIYSREVETVLCEHPGVAEAAVIGVPHEHWGETVRAIVVPRRGAALTPGEILNHCRGRLAGHKKPTSVIFVESLPRGTFGGKILKRLLREQYGAPRGRGQ
jgi:acyl-CoA synthetase (AMP-forming)/AMP-acid ligase II